MIQTHVHGDIKWQASPALCSRLTQLWGQGVACKALAAALSREFGVDITTNMVVGARRRLALPERGSPIRRA